MLSIDMKYRTYIAFLYTYVLLSILKWVLQGEGEEDELQGRKHSSNPGSYCNSGLLDSVVNKSKI